MKFRHLIFIFLMVILVVSVYSLVKETHKFSAGECRICHVVEDESFGALRTVDSSKCKTCHGEEEAQSHPFDIIPATPIPEDMPLVDGRMSCITCHYAHPFSITNKKFTYSLLRKPGKGAVFCSSCHEMDNEGHIVFVIAHSGSYRETNKNTQIDLLSVQCVECHDEYLSKPIRSLGAGLWSHSRSNMQHPVGVSYAAIASRKRKAFNPPSALSPEVRLFDGRIGCGTCHSPSSKEDSLLVTDNKGSKLCLACHRI